MRHRTGFVTAAVIVGLAVIVWMEANVSTADDNWLPRSGSSIRANSVLTPVY